MCRGVLISEGKRIVEHPVQGIFPVECIQVVSGAGRSSFLLAATMIQAMVRGTMMRIWRRRCYNAVIPFQRAVRLYQQKKRFRRAQLERGKEAIRMVQRAISRCDSPGCAGVYSHSHGTDGDRSLNGTSEADGTRSNAFKFAAGRFQ